MTLGEIYTRVMWLVYGDTNYPQSTQQHMQSMAQGIITDAHKKVQQEYDYWFMEHQNIYYRNIGQAVFTLPADFKTAKAVRLYEIGDSLGTYEDVSIDTSGSVNGITGVSYEKSFKQSAINIGDRWYIASSIDDAENVIAYPKEVNIGDASVYDIRFKAVLIRKQVAQQKAYDLIDSFYYYTDTAQLYISSHNWKNELVELIYYKYYTPTEPFTSYTDPVTENAYNAIIYYAVEMEERRRREFQAATYYRQLAADEVQKLKREHLQRRNTNIINYVGD